MSTNRYEAYVAPDIELIAISVELGFSLSSGIRDWEEGENIEGEV